MGLYRKIEKIVTRDNRDAGTWCRRSRFGKWIEDESVAAEYYIVSHLNTRAPSNTKAIFHVSGFPRQGNSTLRLIFLNTFRDAAMPDPLIHVVSLTQKAILDEEIIFLTIRNPHDAILSFMSMNTKLLPNEFIVLTSSGKKRVKIDRYIDFYTRYCVFIKNNINKITVIPFEKIIQMTDDYVAGNIENNEIIKSIADKYSLSITPSVKDYSAVSVFSTSNKEVERLYLSSSYYKRKLKKANKLYKEIIELNHPNTWGHI